MLRTGYGDVDPSPIFLEGRNVVLRTGYGDVDPSPMSAHFKGGLGRLVSGRGADADGRVSDTGTDGRVSDTGTLGLQNISTADDACDKKAIFRGRVVEESASW